MKRHILDFSLKRLTVLFVSALFLPLQVFAGPHDSVSSDGSVMPATTSFEAWGGNRWNKQSESFKGVDEITDEALSTEGATVYDGLGGSFTDEEYEALSALPVPSGKGGLTTGKSGIEVVIGMDTRQRLYTRDYPTRAQVLITFNGGRCSGTMISPDTVATAGHCVHTGGSSGSWRSGFRVYPGADGNSKPYGFCGYRRLYSVSGWTNSGNENYDYGAIKLNCTVGRTVGWYGITTANPLGLPSIVQGYPGDKPLTQWISADKIAARSARQVFYNNDTFGGMSGSAVWFDRNGPYIIGIHAYGKHGSGLHSLYNHGTRIITPVFNNLVSWKNAP